jgi:hypothetical protein
VTECVVRDNMPPSSGAVWPAARSQLEAIRDEWLKPLIDQLRDAERTIGRLEAERDQVAQERDALRSELTSLIHESRPQRSAVAAEAPQRPQDIRQSTWRHWWRRMTGGS